MSDNLPDNSKMPKLMRLILVAVHFSVVVVEEFPVMVVAEWKFLSIPNDGHDGMKFLC